MSFKTLLPSMILGQSLLKIEQTPLEIVIKKFRFESQHLLYKNDNFSDPA